MNTLTKVLMRNAIKYWMPTRSGSSRQVICTSRILFSSQIVKDEAPATAKKSSKEASSPKITLIDDQKIEIVSLEAAKKLSKRRDLKLVKVIDLDAKTQRAVYKLMYDFI